MVFGLASGLVSGLVSGFWLLGLVFKNKAFPLQKCPSHGGDWGTQKVTVAFAGNCLDIMVYMLHIVYIDTYIHIDIS